MLQEHSTNPPALPPGLIDVRGIPGFSTYIIGYDIHAASVWSCRKRHCHTWIMFSNRWRRLKPKAGYKGYIQCVMMRDDGKKVSLRLHEIVALAFIGPKPPGMEVCHGVRGVSDNRPSNISYGTHAQNMGPDRVRDGTDTRGSKSWSARITEDQVVKAREMKSNGTSTREIALMLKVTERHTRGILSGRWWSHVKATAANPAKTDEPKPEKPAATPAPTLFNEPIPE